MSNVDDNENELEGSFELAEEPAKRAGRPPGAVSKKMSYKQMESLLKGNTKEAIIRLVGMMRSENDATSFKACCKILDLGIKLYAEDKELRDLKQEMEKAVEKTPKGKEEFKSLKLVN